MALPSSGALTLNDIQTEFGGSNPISLSEYYAGGSYVPAGTTGTNGAVPSSGAISIYNFYGTTAYTGVWMLFQSFNNVQYSTDQGVSATTNAVTTSGILIGGNNYNNSSYKGWVEYTTNAASITYSFCMNVVMKQAVLSSSSGDFSFIAQDISTSYTVFGAINSSQTITYAKSLTWGSYNAPIGIYVDGFGNTHLTGYSGGTYSNTYLIKYSSTPTRTWTKIIAESSGSRSLIPVNIGYDGNYNPLLPVYATISSSAYQPALLKFNTSGTLQWARALNYTSVSSVTYFVPVATSIPSAVNNYIVSNYSVSGTQYVVVAQYNSSGTLQWQRVLSTASGAIYAKYFAVNKYNEPGNADAIYVTGYTSISSKTVLFIVKYNSSGTIQWQRTMADNYSSSTALYPNYLSVTDSGARILITGYSYTGTGYYDTVTFKVPTDGSHTGSFTCSHSFTYATSTALIDSAGSFTDIDYSSSLTITDGTSAITDSTYSLTKSTISPTNTLTGF